LIGFDPLEQAALTRRVIAKHEELLDARKVQRLVINDGLHHSAVREWTDLDNQAQARAADALADILGLAPSKSAGSSNADRSVQVQIAFVQRPTGAKAPKVVAQARIIDAE
jgi:hypothetical protein